MRGLQQRIEAQRALRQMAEDRSREWTAICRRIMGELVNAGLTDADALHSEADGRPAADDASD